MTDENPLEMAELFPDRENAKRPWEEIHEVSPEALAWFNEFSVEFQRLLFGDMPVTDGLIEHTYRIQKLVQEVREKHNV